MSDLREMLWEGRWLSLLGREAEVLGCGAYVYMHVGKKRRGEGRRMMVKGDLMDLCC